MKRKQRRCATKRFLSSGERAFHLHLKYSCNYKLFYSTLYVSGFYFSIATTGPKPWDHLSNQTLKCRSSNLKINIEYFGLRRYPNAYCYENFASNKSQTKKTKTVGCPEPPRVTPCCAKLLRSRLRNNKEDILSAALLTKTSPSLTIAVFVLSIFMSARKRYLGYPLC